MKMIYIEKIMDSQLYFVSLHSLGFSFQWDGVHAAVFTWIQKKKAKCLVWGFFNVTVFKKRMFFIGL